MHGWRKLWVGAVVLAAVIGGQAPASAQTLIKYNEGPGLKLTDSLVLHGGVAVMSSYDSNVFYSNQGAVGSFFLTPLGHIDLATLSPQRLEGQPEGPTQMVDFRLRFAAGYRAYLSSNQFVKDQSNVDLDGGMSLTINPRGRYRFNINDTYVRTVQPENLQGPGSFIRDYNVAGARLDLAPGGGMLGFTLGYSFTMDWWETKFTALGSGVTPNYFAHSVFLGAKWKFLPKTAVTLDVSEGIVSRPDLTINGDGHPSSYPLRIMAGLIGQLGYRLSATVRAGYGNSFYQSATGRANPAGFNNALVDAGLKWQVATTGALSLGFTRDFQDSMLSDFFTDNRVKLRYDHMILSRLMIGLSGAYTYRQYSGLDPAVWGVSSRNDSIIEGHLGVDWRIRDWLFVGVGYDLAYVNADRQIVYAGGLPYNPNYVKHVVFLRAEVSY